jgi:hypothetical protein
MHRKASTVVVCVLLAASARTASAQSIQSWIDRGYANVNIGFESGSGTLDDSVTFRLYDDNGTKTSSTNVDSGMLFDFSVGARVWRNASVGVGFHIGSSSNEEGTATASVPSPVSFTAPARTVSLNVADLGRTERAIHIQFGYMFPINDKVDVLVLGGPSFFHVAQDVISDITISEVGPPYTSVNGTAVVTEREDTAVGVNIGADITYKLRDTAAGAVGVGAFVRYAGTSTDLQVIQNQASTDLGGFQIGFGARFRF